MKNKSQTVLSLGQMKDLASAMVQGIPVNLDIEEARYWIGHKKELAGKIKKIFTLKPNEDWLQEILNHERQCHLDFFLQKFNLSEFERTLKEYGQETIKEWQKLGLEPHFLPKASMMPTNNYPGWKIKPEKWFYDKVAQGRILRNIDDELTKVEGVELEGVTVLIDIRLKPKYRDGKQMYKNDDLLGTIIKQLRKDEKIAKYEYGPQSSRFSVSANEWEGQIKPALAKKLGLGVVQLRLERTIEANVIPQLYSYMPRKDDGNTDTWVWYEEYFGDRDDRLNGGGSDNGGLADVSYFWADNHWSFRSVRSLAVL